MSVPANLGAAAGRAAQVLAHWKSDDEAWSGSARRTLRSDETDALLALLDSPDLTRSGRAMWNLGM